VRLVPYVDHPELDGTGIRDNRHLLASSPAEECPAERCSRGELPQAMARRSVHDGHVLVNVALAPNRHHGPDTHCVDHLIHDRLLDKIASPVIRAIYDLVQTVPRAKLDIHQPPDSDCGADHRLPILWRPKMANEAPYASLDLQAQCHATSPRSRRYPLPGAQSVGDRRGSVRD